MCTYATIDILDTKEDIKLSFHSPRSNISI